MLFPNRSGNLGASAASAGAMNGRAGYFAVRRRVSVRMVAVGRARRRGAIRHGDGWPTLGTRRDSRMAADCPNSCNAGTVDWAVMALVDWLSCTGPTITESLPRSNANKIVFRLGPFVARAVGGWPGADDCFRRLMLERARRRTKEPAFDSARDRARPRAATILGRSKKDSLIANVIRIM